MSEFSPEIINSVCLWYRHDFGLLPEGAQDMLRFEAMEWYHAWKKELDYQAKKTGDNSLLSP